jgi:non-heme chloroperoxidase
MKRREFLKVSTVGAAAAAVASPVVAQSPLEIKRAEPSETTRPAKSFLTTEDQTTIFYKDWGPRDAQPICFHHGWPTSSDD